VPVFSTANIVTPLFPDIVVALISELSLMFMKALAAVVLFQTTVILSQVSWGTTISDENGGIIKESVFDEPHIN